jgi:hypothetical protein
LLAKTTSICDWSWGMFMEVTMFMEVELRVHINHVSFVTPAAAAELMLQSYVLPQAAWRDVIDVCLSFMSSCIYGVP